MSKVPKPRTLVPQGPQTKGGSNRQCNGMINNEQLYPLLDMDYLLSPLLKLPWSIGFRDKIFSMSRMPKT